MTDRQAKPELLSNDEMARADALAIAGGVAGLSLMENAGRAVADAAVRMAKPGSRIAVLCGPGNNGGDGFAAARLLSQRGFDVHIGLLGDVARLSGDARAMARRWRGAVLPLAGVQLAGAGLIVDALFGAGLSRAIEGMPAQVIGAVNDAAAAACPVLAVDVPSGVNGSSGLVDGPAVTATGTVTFFRRKPGHLLLPGRALCGVIELAQIGIPAGVLAEIRPRCFVNAPVLWRGDFPAPRPAGHKYDRGHAVVVSGPAQATGAARLAARAALRVGAGLVSLASPMDALAVNAAHLTAIMLQPFDVPDGLAQVLADRRCNACVIGPGCGVNAATCEMAAIALASDAAVVLDADALTSFAGAGASAADAGSSAGSLFAMIARGSASQCSGSQRNVVMTPHEGEFARLFGEFPARLSKRDRAVEAASRSGAVVVLKGADTVIAAPDGRAAINENAPATLATAGSGDVLAGFIAGLMAQGMAGFAAASAAVWLHGECANLFGPGLIAEDLPEILPQVLRGPDLA